MDKDAQGQTRVGAWPTLVVCTLVVERAKVLQYRQATLPGPWPLFSITLIRDS